MVNHGTGWVRLDYLVPARGLIGFRTEFITETRGTGMLHHVFEGFEPWFGDLRTRPNGSLVADRRASRAHAVISLQERGELFIVPAVEVYEGMVMGVNARAEDLDVNACKEKQAGNVRSATPSSSSASSRRASSRSSRRWSSSATTRASRSRRRTCGCARSCCPPADARRPHAPRPLRRSAPSSAQAVSSVNALADGSRASGPSAPSSTG